MDFGVWDHFEWQKDKSLKQQYEERVALVQQVEEYGFWAYHIAEHHFSTLDAAPSPNVFLGALSRETTRITLGAMVLVLPLYHPMRLIQELCMLDHMLDGRLVQGLGRGIRPVEHEWYGLDPKKAREHFAEVLEITRQGVDVGRLNYHSERYHFDDVPVLWEPVQRPMRFFYAGNLAYAASEGMDCLTFPAPREQFEEFWQIWEDRRRAGNPRYQREPKVGGFRHIYVAETDEAAERIVQRAWPVQGDNFWATSLPVPRGSAGVGYGEDPEKARARGLLDWGSPETLRANFQAAIEQAGPGYNYHVIAPQWGDITHEEARESLRLYVEEVMPALAMIPTRSLTASV